MNERPAVGDRVMRTYGRKNYAEYGEVGTVSAVGDDGWSFSMVLDDYQPFAKAMWGGKSSLNGHGKKTHEVLGRTEVTPLVEVYRGNAERIRQLAQTWDDAADKEEAGLNSEGN